jgi:hypothetical protein
MYGGPQCGKPKRLPLNFQGTSIDVAFIPVHICTRLRCPRELMSPVCRRCISKISNPFCPKKKCSPPPKETARALFCGSVESVISPMGHHFSSAFRSRLCTHNTSTIPWRPLQGIQIATAMTLVLCTRHPTPLLCGEAHTSTSF